jgi:hypothetical protein
MDNALPTIDENAEVFRGRAEQARLAAKGAIDPRDRRIFEKLAAPYEELAHTTERLEGQA